MNARISIQDFLHFDYLVCEEKKALLVMKEFIGQIELTMTNGPPHCF